MHQLNHNYIGYVIFSGKPCDEHPVHMLPIRNNIADKQKQCFRSFCFNTYPNKTQPLKTEVFFIG